MPLALTATSDGNAGRAPRRPRLLPVRSTLHSDHHHIEVLRLIPRRLYLSCRRGRLRHVLR